MQQEEGILNIQNGNSIIALTSSGVSVGETCGGMSLLILYLFLGSVSLFVVSCSNKEDNCSINPNTGWEVLPDECFDCEWYAPESATLSNMGYSTVEQARNCFACHRETLKEHQGDTLMLTGWLCWGSTTWVPDYMNGSANNFVYCTDREDHLDESIHTFTVTLSPDLKAKFQENYEQLLQEKWFIIGILKAHDLHTGGCCSVVPVLDALEFMTVNI